MQNIKHVLVTGGAGYVGSVLVPKLLQAGYRVTVLDWYIYGDTLASVKNHPLLQEIKGDLRDKETVQKALTGVDAVIHLACISNDPSFELDPNLGKSVNYDASIQLFDLAKHSGIKRVVYASSSSVYGVKEEEKVTENLSLEPLTDYSKYKALCERYLLPLNSDDFTVLVLRPATVCGYSPRLRLDLTVNILTCHALEKGVITVFGGEQARPNIHIEDMTDLYVQTLSYPKEKIAGKIFNAGYENYPLNEIAAMVKKVVGDQVTITKKDTPDKRSYRVDSTKIKKELGFSTKRTVEDAITDLVQAFRTGLVLEALTNPRYYNIKTMQNYLSQKNATKPTVDRSLPTVNDVAIIRRLLLQTLRIRMVEEKIAAVYPEKEIRCPMHLCTGQEAVPAGVCSALELYDHVMGTHRAHGHYLAKGGNLNKMLAEMYGKETGCCAGVGGSQHLIDLSVNFFGSTPIVGGTIPIATGLAWASKLNNEPRVTTVFFGDGASEEGVLHESMNFAALHKLPIMYVCENNLYSVYTPINERQPKRKISDIARAHGLTVLEGNGNDAFEVYAKTKDALRYIHADKGPTFLEFATYRWREHCGHCFDNDLGYRTEEEFQVWKNSDPIKIIEKYALENCFINEQELVEIKDSIAREIEIAIQFAKQSPYPVNSLTTESCYG